MEKEIESLKKKAALKAIKDVKDGQVIGIGTGSTVYYVIQALADKLKEGNKIIGIPTSKQSETIARELKIPILQLNDIETIDLIIDGADEIDRNLNMIKGGGGALTREKLVALAAKERIFVADETKIVKTLGKIFPLPVEVLAFSWRLSQRHLQNLGCQADLRVREGINFETDNGNYILDCRFDGITDPEELEKKIKLLPGVIECGLFVGIADKVIIGYKDKVEVKTRK